jgi:hypothetical protein
VTWQAGLIGQERVEWKGIYAAKRVAPDRLGAVLRPLACTIVSLQRKPEASDLAALEAAAGRPVLELSAINEDLPDALALLSLLDDYVGVSNTNMHLLAGIEGLARIEGPRAHVLLETLAEWRWGIAGDSSPWFPRFHLYRATQQEGWSLALARLTQDLAKSLPRRP